MSRKIPIAINLWILACSCLLYCFSSQLGVVEYSEDILSVQLLLGLISIIAYCMKGERQSSLKEQLFRPSTFFLCGFFIVFFQKNVDLLLGFSSPYDRFYTNPDVILKGANVANIGLSSFLVGYMYATKRCIYVARSAKQYSVTAIKYLFILTVFLYYIFVGYDMLHGNVIYSQELLEARSGSIQAYLEVFVNDVFYAYMTLSLFTQEKDELTFFTFLKRNGILFNASCLLYMLAHIVIGDRGEVIAMVLVYAMAGVVITRRKIGVKVFCTILLLGACWAATIGLGERSNSMTISDLLEGKSIRDEASILPFTEELAGSYRTLTLSLDRVPLHHDYLYGSLQFRELLSCIPLMGKIGVYEFFDPHFKYKNSPMFCTWLDQGDYYTYGSGSSLLADIYLSFGIVGIVFLMFWLGMLFRKLDVVIFDTNASVWWLLVAIIFTGNSIYISRATLLTPLYNFIPSSLVVVLSGFLCYKSSNKRV